jgi:DNA-binding response OmpR family regulator
VIEDEARVARALSDGIEVLGTMRSRNRGIPVLVVTLRASDEDHVIGLAA